MKRSLLLISILILLSGCASQDILNRIEKNIEKLVILGKGQLNILTEVNKTNTKVIKISENVNKQLNNIPLRGGGLIPEGMNWTFQIILIILGIKNGGQILGFARTVAVQLLKKTKKIKEV